MKKKGGRPADVAALRRRAEERLKRQEAKDGGWGAEVASTRLLHEVQVHQLELEMQNEELRQARAQAEVLLAQYADLYDFAPVGYMTLDREGVIRRVNLTGERLFGVARSRLVGRRLGLLVAKADRRAVGDFLQKIFVDQIGEHCEVTVPQAGGGSLVLQIEGTISADGRECRAVVLDVSERRQADRALRLHSAALDAAADAIIITDRDGTIEWINAAFTSLSGYGVEEAVGRNPRDLMKSGVHDRAFYKNLWDTLLAGQVWSGEMTNRRKDGSLYQEAQTITPVRDPQGAIGHFVAVKRDLTEQHALEARFLLAQKMDTVGRLAGGIAHDFNNLLTIVNGTTDLALADLKEGDPLRSDLEQVREAGERAAALTRQLLAFSRRQIMKPEVLNLGALVANLQGMLRRLIGEDIALVVLPPTQTGSVMADPGQIEQVVMNLVVNARDAMPGGGTLIIETRDVEIDEAFAAEHPPTPPGPHVMLAISDTGVGMDEATRARVFEPFFSTKDPAKGTGLGLSTVYGIIEQSGGHIRVQSEPGRGTTCRIYLPRLEEAAPEVHVVPLVSAARGAETILVVEDEDAVRNLAQRMLQLGGYSVLTAGDGEEALRLLGRHDGPVHLILTDMVMPGMTGKDLADRIGAIEPRVKILFTSGYPGDAFVHSGLLDRDAPFIAKPYTVAALTRKVREVLDSSGRRPTTA